jgi:hypothetical protein
VETVAAGLDRVAAEAAAPNRSLTAAVPLRHDVIGPARADLVALAAELRAAARPSAMGVALSRQLLIDIAGPLYSGEGPFALVQTVRVARAALADADG